MAQARKQGAITGIRKEKTEDSNFRTRNGQLKREKMLGRLLAATMEVRADPARRGVAVVEDVVKIAGVSRGAFYWYFDTLDEAFEALGRQLADEISAESRLLFADADGVALRSALGGQIILCRASMDRVWAGYLSNVHILLDDSQFVNGVRGVLERGREEGLFQFESLTIALDYQIGAIIAAVRHCAAAEPPARAKLTEMNALILRGLGVKPSMATEIAKRAAQILDELGPHKLSWWRDIP